MKKKITIVLIFPENTKTISIKEKNRETKIFVKDQNRDWL